MSQPAPVNTPTAPETIDDATLDKIIAQGKDIAAMGAVDVTKPLAAQLAAALQAKVAALIPKATAAAATAAAQRQQAAQTGLLDKYHQLWAAIHQRRKSDLWKPGTSDLPFLKDIISKVPGCPRCRANAEAYLAKHPPDFTSVESYFAWTVDFHNSASVDAGKPPFTLAQARAAWPA